MNRQRLLAYAAIIATLASIGVYRMMQTNADTPITNEKTDRLNQSFTGSKYTSKYHIYAAGLDWSKSVGLLVYTDGSGEYGLKNPTSNYLLSGANGMVNTAKKHNMVLVTPFSPNTNCSDGDGSCWYLGDSPGYTKWAEELIAGVESTYPIQKSRVAFGGYSSGAQLATEYWVPSGAAQRTMDDGVIVAISYGGSPKMTEVTYSESFKQNVHLAWDVGDKDEAYTASGQYGAKAGHDSYKSKGFSTSIRVVPGLGHDRSNQFGTIMDGFITTHVPSASSTTPTPTPPTPPATPPATPPTTPPGTPPVTPPANPSGTDLNDDGKVDLKDLSILLSNWNSASATPTKGDINKDGKISLSDLSLLLSDWTT